MDTGDVPTGGRRYGPWDISDVPGWSNEFGRLDLGSLIVSPAIGTQVRLEAADDQLIAATFVLDGSQIQLQAFASTVANLWDDVRREIKDGLRQWENREAVEAMGSLGPELIVPPAGDGKGAEKGDEALSFVGSDGPGWLLRGVFSGPAVAPGPIRDKFERLFRSTIVVRGDQALPERAPLPLRPPLDAQIQRR
jgi:hypothetical protein